MDRYTGDLVRLEQRFKRFERAGLASLVLGGAALVTFFADSLNYSFSGESEKTGAVTPTRHVLELAGGLALLGAAGWLYHQRRKTHERICTYPDDRLE